MTLPSPSLPLEARFNHNGAVCEIAAITGTAYFVRSKHPRQRTQTTAHPHALVEVWHRDWQANAIDPATRSK